jgi:hypothetical protein
VQRLGGDRRVKVLVTLGTPHGGSTAAWLLAWVPLVAQLRPGSATLAELAQPAPGCRTRFVAFYSNLDEVVIPATRARIDHPDLRVENVLVRGVGHLTLPVHPEVIRQICDPGTRRRCGRRRVRTTGRADGTVSRQGGAP